MNSPILIKKQNLRIFLHFLLFFYSRFLAVTILFYFILFYFIFDHNADNEKAKAFINSHPYHYDLLVLNTCPFRFIPYDILFGLLTMNENQPRDAGADPGDDDVLDDDDYLLDDDDDVLDDDDDVLDDDDDYKGAGRVDGDGKVDDDDFLAVEHFIIARMEKIQLQMKMRYAMRKLWRQKQTTEVVCKVSSGEVLQQRMSKEKLGRVAYEKL